MIKVTHVLKEYPNTPQGYAQMYPPTQQEEWDKILETCNQYNAQYCNHTISHAWVEDTRLEPYTPEFNRDMQIPVGTTQYLITVYMQDKDT